jgi:uncharacterized protein (DUF2236 family)
VSVSTQLRAEQTAVGVPPEVREVFIGASLLAASANVVMQLSLLPVGRGVAESRVHSGRADKHPVKRLRTTLGYLAVAAYGTDRELLALRHEVNRSHQQVHSLADDPVAYNAFDPELQLWVAACLHKGGEDLYRMIHRQPDPQALDRLYHYNIRLATTLQVPAAMWPPDRQAFERYWEQGVERIEMDAVTRQYLQDLATVAFITARLGSLGKPLRSFSEFFCVGFLPPPFRDELGLPWSPGRQRAFDALVPRLVRASSKLPSVLRAFPYNLYLWDTRRRLNTGRPFV